MYNVHAKRFYDESDAIEAWKIAFNNNPYLLIVRYNNISSKREVSINRFWCFNISYVKIGQEKQFYGMQTSKTR